LKDGFELFLENGEGGGYFLAAFAGVLLDQQLDAGLSLEQGLVPLPVVADILRHASYFLEQNFVPDRVFFGLDGPEPLNVFEQLLLGQPVEGGVGLELDALPAGLDGRPLLIAFLDTLAQLVKLLVHELELLLLLLLEVEPVFEQALLGGGVLGGQLRQRRLQLAVAGLWGLLLHRQPLVLLALVLQSADALAEGQHVPLQHLFLLLQQAQLLESFGVQSPATVVFVFAGLLEGAGVTGLQLNLLLKQILE
jgi:hypothetical protein